jgi:phospholipase A1
MANFLKNILIFTVLNLLFLNVALATTAAKNDNSVDENLQKALNLPPANESTALSQRMAAESRADDDPYSLVLYKPTYFMPFYYTQSPDQAVYINNTPLGQKIMSEEFKGQLSFQAPIVYEAFGPRNTLSLAYTQLSYWQVYADSQYFRETDYEPEIFFSHVQTNYFNWKVGAQHQSNGRGGEGERSWNRLYGAVTVSGSDWVLSLQPWMLIFVTASSQIHNPDITRFMGNGEENFSYKFNNLTVSVMLRNNLESKFARGTGEVDFTFPLTTHFHGFVQFFSGYGQSLIEYNHYTNAFGIGFALNAPI